MTWTEPISESEISLLKEIINLLQNGQPAVVQVKRKLIEEFLGYSLLHQEGKKRRPASPSDFATHLRNLAPTIPELLPELLEGVLSAKAEALLSEVWRMADYNYIPPKDVEKDLYWLCFYWSIWPASRGLFKITKESLEAKETWDFSKTKEALEKLKETRDFSKLWDSGISTSKEPFEGFEDLLDLSLVKLAYRVGVEISGVRQWGRREWNRTAKGIRKKQEIKIINAQPVIDAFRSLKFPKEAFPQGASLHKVAEMIKNTLRGKITDPPSIDTIKRILKDDKAIWEQFKEVKIKGRKYFIIKQT